MTWKPCRSAQRHVHPHQHLGPVLRLGPAGAGVDREQRIARVVGALQHRLELERFDRVIEGIGLPRHLVLHGGVGLVLEQLGHLQRPGEARVELLPGRDPALESLDLLHGDPGACRDWPRSRPRPARPRGSAGARPWRSGQRKSRSSVTRCCSSVRRSTRSAMSVILGTRGNGKIVAWREGRGAGGLPAVGVPLESAASPDGSSASTRDS